MVQLFVTCLVDGLFPQVGQATVEVLERAGETVEFPYDQTCCGQPAFNAGHRSEAARMARHTLDVLDGTDGPIVLPSGSCADMIIHHYAELELDENYRRKAERVAARTHELTSYLVDELGEDTLDPSCQGCTATYHASCHGLRNLGISDQPKRLLDAVEGLSRVDLEGEEECCGFGGLFSVEMPEVSAAIMNTKLDKVEAAGVDVLVGTDVSCLMHMAGGLQRRGSDMTVKHIAEILAGDLA